MDVHSKALRSKNMRAITARNTKIEFQVGELLTDCGAVYRMHDSLLPGKPDFVIESSRCVIFTHGCFWHHHHCYLFKLPATRTDFWQQKIAANVVRDKRNIEALLSLNWRVLVVWECALRGKGRLSDKGLTERLEEWICSGVDHAEIDMRGIHQAV